MTPMCSACRNGAHRLAPRPRDTGVSVHDRREALARMLFDLADLEECIAITRAEIAAEEGTAG